MPQEDLRELQYNNSMEKIKDKAGTVIFPGQLIFRNGNYWVVTDIEPDGRIAITELGAGTLVDPKDIEIEGELGG